MRRDLLMMLSLSLLIACNTRNSGADNGNRQSGVDSSKEKNIADSTAFVYDSSRDGMLRLPKNTRILGDTLGIKFYEVTLAPGDSMPLHAHPDHVFYALEGGRGAIYMNGGDRQEGEMMKGEGFVHGPVVDAGVNIGKTTMKFLVVDIYRPRK